jgi:hypothetical protein
MVAHNKFPTRVIYELLSRVVAGVCLSGTVVNEQNVPTQYGGRPSEQQQQQPCGIDRNTQLHIRFPGS